MKGKTLLDNVHTKMEGMIIVSLFIWNLLEGAVFENVYPYALVKLYKYPIWRAAFVLLIIFSSEWSPIISLMLSLTLFFYIMDIEVTREKWSRIELNRNS